MASIKQASNHDLTTGNCSCLARHARPMSSVPVAHHEASDDVIDISHGDAARSMSSSSSSEQESSMSSSSGGLQTANATPRDSDEKCCLHQAFTVILQRDTVASKSLIQAHLDLDRFHYGNAEADIVSWTNVHACLKHLNITNALQLCQYSSDDPIDHRTSSDRLLARLDKLFQGDAVDGVTHRTLTRQFSTVLSRSELRAFNACLQIWRKSFRGVAAIQRSSGRCIDCRLRTSIEITALDPSRRREPRSILFCIHPAREPLCLHCLSDLDRITDRQQDRHRFKNAAPVIICCDSVLRWREATHVLTQRGYRDFIYNAHFGLAEKDCQVLPASVLRWRSSHSLKASFPGIEGIIASRQPSSVSLVAADSIKDHLSKLPKIPATTKLPSLATLCAKVLQRSIYISNKHLSLSPEGMPRHLFGLIDSVYRCVSCRHLMAPPNVYDGETGFHNMNQRAQQAGFTMKPKFTAVWQDLLQSGSAWLPPFWEGMDLVDSSRRQVPAGSARIFIGGYFVGMEEPTRASLACDEDDLFYRFCASCASSHLGLRPAEGACDCQCPVCAQERSHQSVPWKRAARTRYLARREVTMKESLARNVGLHLRADNRL